ncbi:MAG: CrcB family protein, partial [Terrimicrobiaceae bacterium]|nr:CrcB family protein [Terrimicrobiaceae bacterium]
MCIRDRRMAISGGIANYFGATFPWGTLLVNVSGCFIIGVFAALAGPDSPLLISPLVRQTVMIGILGGYTTFSSFSLQTLELAANGEWLPALGNVAGTVITCLLATWAGLALPALILNRSSLP